MRKPEIIEEGKGREAKCFECGTRFRFFPENVWYGGRDSDEPLVHCPREGCRDGAFRSRINVRALLKEGAK